jgi:hypothetical protein
MYNTCSGRGILNKEPSTKDTALIDEQSILIKASFACDWIKYALIFSHFSSFSLGDTCLRMVENEIDQE